MQKTEIVLKTSVDIARIRRSARIIEKNGFKAITLGGYPLSATILGKPDVSLLTLTESTSVAVMCIHLYRCIHKASGPEPAEAPRPGEITNGLPQLALGEDPLSVLGRMRTEAFSVPPTPEPKIRPSLPFLPTDKFLD